MHWHTVIEMTSGNTGIGMAMVCAAKGYPFIAVMPENCSIERRKILRFYGAKVVPRRELLRPRLCHIACSHCAP